MVGILVLDQHGGTFFGTPKAEFHAALILQYASWYQVTEMVNLVGGTNLEYMEP